MTKTNKNVIVTTRNKQTHKKARKKMFNLPQAEQKKIVNKSAKALGLFARKQNATINNKQAYKLEERATGLTVL